MEEHHVETRKDSEEKVWLCRTCHVIVTKDNINSRDRLDAFRAAFRRRAREEGGISIERLPD